MSPVRLSALPKHQSSAPSVNWLQIFTSKLKCLKLLTTSDHQHWASVGPSFNTLGSGKIWGKSHTWANAFVFLYILHVCRYDDFPIKTILLFEISGPAWGGFLYQALYQVWCQFQSHSDSPFQRWWLDPISSSYMIGYLYLNMFKHITICLLQHVLNGVSNPLFDDWIILKHHHLAQWIPIVNPIVAKSPLFDSFLRKREETSSVLNHLQLRLASLDPSFI